ncbi:hypothetical protein POM88_020852 [Heracleum sosnowskyi]|uniref:Uncharacterized protein n=1 Tax=Heracleum sosnowskyi TaxID=360622 RepID=A0AAD8MS94_9APIA|nr:hypothetical protein POM88_020852 [Heracleum sosnowskyi]
MGLRRVKKDEKVHGAWNVSYGDVGEMEAKIRKGEEEVHLKSSHVTYLTIVWGLSVSHIAGIINVWNVLTFFLPIRFAFFVDSFFGNFHMLKFSCFVDAIGLGFLTLSTPQFLGPFKFGIPAICSLPALLIFLIGQFCHPSQRKGPQGSPLTTILRVFVATISKKSEKLPEDHNTESFYQSDDHVEFTHSFGLLNKAARIIPIASIEEQKKNKWHLCSVKEVEDTKVYLRMTPLCITLVLCGLVLSLGNTYFLEQANDLNQTLGRLKVNIVIFFFFSFGANIITSTTC